MKLIVALLLALPIISNAAKVDRAKQILKQEGYVHITGKHYYVPKLTTRSKDGIAWYVVSELHKTNSRFSMTTRYKAIGCKEKLSVDLVVQIIPFIGKTIIKDYRKTITNKSFKPLTNVDKILYSKLCK